MFVKECDASRVEVVHCDVNEQSKSGRGERGRESAMRGEGSRRRTEGEREKRKHRERRG